MSDPDAEYVARCFHSHYERLAPEYGYTTRPDSAVPFDQVPDPNRSLMIAVAGHVLRDIADRTPASVPLAEHEAKVAERQALSEKLVAEAVGRNMRLLKEQDDRLIELRAEWLADVLAAIDAERDTWAKAANSCCRSAVDASTRRARDAIKALGEK